MIKDTGHFCEHPFMYTEFHESGEYLCCPDWNTTNIGNSDNKLDNWFSKEAEEVRTEMLKGNFKNCLPDRCPVLNTFLKTGKPTHSIRPLSEFDPLKYNLPHRFKICKDKPCNLQCPSCRLDFIPNSDKNTIETTQTLEAIQRDYGPELKEIFLSGGGDPFYSNPIRNFFIDFDETKFPALENIILHTNAIMWTPKLWAKMHKIHKYVNRVEISIDAATKDTYENKVRIRGKWDTLMQNLEYINSLESIEHIATSFVVQQANYKEMEDFVKMSKEIFKSRGKRLHIQFYKIVDWGLDNLDELRPKQIWKEDHPEYQDYIKEVAKIEKYENVISNLN